MFDRAILHHYNTIAPWKDVDMMRHEDPGFTLTDFTLDRMREQMLTNMSIDRW